MLTIHRTYSRCGHTETVKSWQKTDEERTQTLDQLCDECRANPAIVAAQPEWQRFGYASPAAYDAALVHEAEVRKVEREREARVAALFALPASERPFRGAPLSGAPTLDDVAREDGEG